MTTITKNDNIISDAEIKLGLNLVKAFVKICKEDSAFVVEMKESLGKIDKSLKTGDEETLLSCNKEMTKRFRHILLVPGSGLVAIDEQTMRSKSFNQKYWSLYAIGECLIKEIKKEKFGEGLVEGFKVGVQYAFDKATAYQKMY